VFDDVVDVCCYFGSFEALLDINAHPGDLPFLLVILTPFS